MIAKICSWSIYRPKNKPNKLGNYDAQNKPNKLGNYKRAA
jgi:hypothetical protein